MARDIDRRRNSEGEKKFTKEQESEICKLYIKEMVPLADIARMFNVEGRIIKGCLKRNNIGIKSIKLQINTGDKFGRWTVIEEVKQRGYRRYFLCECSCPDKTKREVPLYSLRNGHSRSCGCLHKEIISKRGIDSGRDYTGRVFGRLTVLYEVDRGKHKGRRVIAKCSCDGNMDEYYLNRLMSNNITSCGCYKSESTSRRCTYQLKDYQEKHPLFCKIEEIRDCENEPGIEGRCKHCGEWFKLTYSQIRHRISVIEKPENHSLGTEKNFYCSDKCKDECDVYGAVTIPKSLRTVKKQSRCNQRTNKKALLDLQFDEFGYNFCEICGNQFKRSELIIHHNIMVGLDHGMADDMSHQIIVCKDHHEHKNCLK